MRSGLSFSYMISLNLVGCSFPVYLFLPRCWALTSSEGGWPSTSISSKSIDCRKEEVCLSDTVWFRSGTHIKNKKLKKLMLTAITLNDSKSACYEKGSSSAITSYLTEKLCKSKADPVLPKTQSGSSSASTAGRPSARSLWPHSQWRAPNSACWHACATLLHPSPICEYFDKKSSDRSVQLSTQHPYEELLRACLLLHHSSNSLDHPCQKTKNNR